MALFLLFSAQLFPAGGAGITSSNFLKLSQGARPAGMGEAFVAIADDVNAVYWNPAGLAQLTRNQVCLMHSVWLVDVNFEYMAYALPIKGFGTIAAYGLFLNAGEIFKTGETPAGDYLYDGAKIKATDFNVTVAYAKKLSEIIGDDSLFADLSLGINVNIISETIADDTGGGFGVNIGAYFYPRYENYSMGLTLENIGVANNRPSLPSVVKFGFGYRFPLENAFISFTEEGSFNYIENNAAGSVDILYYPVEGFFKVRMGVEKYWELNKFHTIALRLGYKFFEDLGALAGITAGFGYRLTVNKETTVDVDYVMSPYAELGLSQRISVTGKFLGTPESHSTENPKEASVYYKKGYELLYKKQFSNALIEFSECIKRYRNYAPSYMGIGACFLNMGKKAMAMKAYAKALEIDPTNTKLKDYVEQLKAQIPPVPGR